MTTTTKSVNKLGYMQGLHPNSLANLKPNLKGRPPNPLTITSRQKEKLLEPCPFDSQGRPWIEALAEGGMRQALNIPSAMSNLQDRHEGKVPGDIPTSYQDNRVINVIVSSEKAKELTENVSKRLLSNAVKKE